MRPKFLGRLPELLRVSLSIFGARGDGCPFPEGGIMHAVRSTPPVEFGAPLPEGSTLAGMLQDLIDAVPPEQEEYSVVGTREFFASMGIDPKTLDADGPELNPEEYRKLWGGK